MSQYTVSSSPGLTHEQQAVEQLWCLILKELVKGKDSTTISIPFASANCLGKDGIDAIAQRCRAFSDSLVEVRNDKEADSIRIAVFSHSAKKKREIAQMTAKTDSPGPSGRSGKPPRPPNSFILYRQHHHAGMVAKHPAQLIGAMWKKEPQSVRDEWKRKADFAKIQHEQQHPDYQYQPRKPSEKKRRMTKKKAEKMTAVGDHNAFDTSTSTAVPSANVPNPLPAPSMTWNDNYDEATFTYDPNRHGLQTIDEFITNYLRTTADPLLPTLPWGVVGNAPSAAQQQAAESDFAIDQIEDVEDEIFATQVDFEQLLNGEVAAMRGTHNTMSGNEEPDMDLARFEAFLTETVNGL
uniref:MAT1-2-1 n=1 Tax=Elsinoe australis TaxID=40998 RepID=A0A7D6EUK0_9PEZI|nr:MAT1-2-1 [Elsinoe australis]